DGRAPFGSTPAKSGIASRTQRTAGIPRRARLLPVIDWGIRMKKTKLLNQPLSAVIAGMGHKDTLVIGDAGLPIPPYVERIDLAVSAGLPPFMEVLEAVLSELQVEEAIIAEELQTRSPDLYRRLMERLGDIPVRA